MSKMVSAFGRFGDSEVAGGDLLEGIAFGTWHDGLLERLRNGVDRFSEDLL